MGRSVVTWRDAGKREGVEPDDLKTAILKYIPAEIVMAFVAADAALKSASSVPATVPWLVFVVLWILTPIYMFYATRDPAKPTPKAQIVVATFSFLVWVFTLGGPFATLPGYSSVYGAVVLPIFTLIPPIILHGSPPAK